VIESTIFLNLYLNTVMKTVSDNLFPTFYICVLIPWKRTCQSLLKEYLEAYRTQMNSLDKIKVSVFVIFYGWVQVDPRTAMKFQNEDTVEGLTGNLE
jgi:hypothetical protein